MEESVISAYLGTTEDRTRYAIRYDNSPVTLVLKESLPVFLRGRRVRPYEGPVESICGKIIPCTEEECRVIESELGEQ